MIMIWSGWPERLATISGCSVSYTAQAVQKPCQASPVLTPSRTEGL